MKSKENLGKPKENAGFCAWPGNLRDFAGQQPPEAALAADKTSAVSAAKKAATSAATSDISNLIYHTMGVRRRRPLPQGVVDFIEMSDVAADVAAFLAADTTDVLSATKAAGGGFCLAKNPCASGQGCLRRFFPGKMATPKIWTCQPGQILTILGQILIKK